MAVRKPRAKSKPKVVEEKIQCRRCRRTITTTNYYEATNTRIDTNGYLSVCKSCVKDLYEWHFRIHKTVETALFHVCSELDIRYEPSVVESAMSHIKTIKDSGGDSDAIFGYYKSKLSTFGKANGYEEFRFKDSSVLSEGTANQSRQYNPDEYQSVEVSYLRARWGDMKIEDLQWLEQKWEEWSQGFEIDSKSRTLIVEQIVFEEFYIFQERSRGGDVSKRLKSIKDLMGLGNLQPKQEMASETAEFSTLAEFIKKVETSKPIIMKNKELEDVDGFTKMWKSLAGAIARTIGRADENTAVFDKTYEEQTLNMSSLDGGEQ